MPSPWVAPLWSPDGNHIVFASDRSGTYDLYTKSAGGVGEEQVLLKSPPNETPEDWSRDGQFILYRSQGGDANSDLWVLPLTGNREPRPVVETPFTEAQGRFSPDGRWLAYVSNESGGWELSPDGRRFLIDTVTEGGTGSILRITVLANWFASPDARR